MASFDYKPESLKQFMRVAVALLAFVFVIGLGEQIRTVRLFVLPGSVVADGRLLDEFERTSTTKRGTVYRNYDITYTWGDGHKASEKVSDELYQTARQAGALKIRYLPDSPETATLDVRRESGLASLKMAGVNLAALLVAILALVGISHEARRSAQAPPA